MARQSPASRSTPATKMLHRLHPSCAILCFALLAGCTQILSDQSRDLNILSNESRRQCESLGQSVAPLCSKVIDHRLQTFVRFDSDYTVALDAAQERERDLEARLILAKAQCGPVKRAGCFQLWSTQKELDEVRRSYRRLLWQKHKATTDLTAAISATPSILRGHKQVPDKVCSVRDDGSVDCVDYAALLAFFDARKGRDIRQDVEKIYAVHRFRPLPNLFKCGDGTWGASEGGAADEVVTRIAKICLERRARQRSSTVSLAGQFRYTGTTGFDPFGSMCGFEVVNTTRTVMDQMMEMANNYNQYCGPRIQQSLAAGANYTTPPMEITIGPDNNNNGVADYIQACTGNSCSFEFDPESSQEEIAEGAEAGGESGEGESEEGESGESGEGESGEGEGEEGESGEGENGEGESGDGEGQGDDEPEVVQDFAFAECMDFGDGTCSTCENLSELIGDCLRSRGQSPECKAYDYEAQCCRQTPGNPHVLIPNPNGDFACVPANIGDTKERACTERCKVADENCYENCMASDRYTLAPGAVDTYCLYAYSEECAYGAYRTPIFEPEVGGGLPPLPTNLARHVLLPRPDQLVSPKVQIR